MLAVSDAGFCEREDLMADKPTPSIGDTIANLRSADSPLHALRGFFGNAWIKMRKRDNCCGNYGDPGC